MSKYETWLQSAPKNLEPAKLWELFAESHELTQSERWQEFNQLLLPKLVSDGTQF